MKTGCQRVNCTKNFEYSERPNQILEGFLSSVEIAFEKNIHF